MGSHSGHSGLAEEAGVGIAPGDAAVNPVIPGGQAMPGSAGR